MTVGTEGPGEVRYLPVWVGSALVLVDQRVDVGRERVVLAGDLLAVWATREGQVELHLDDEVLHTVPLTDAQLDRFVRLWTSARE